MGKAAYGVGDIVVLKESPVRTSRADGKFKIIGVLPVSNGLIQYRVRSESEGFDRRITSDDVDTDHSSIPHVAAAKIPAAAKEPWFNPSSIKIGK
jgi:hypothetical protein